MRNVLIVFISMVLLSAERSPKLAKHYQGVYAGTAQFPALNINGATQSVARTIVSLSISEKELQLHIGEASFTASYTIDAVTKTYYTLKANFDEPLGACTFAVYKKGKKTTWQQTSVEEEVVLVKE